MQEVPILVTLDFSDEHIEKLQSLSERLTLRRAGTREPGEIAEALDAHPETRVLYATTHPDRWSPAWALEWVQFHYAGADHVDFDLIPEQVRLTTASGVHASVLAEHTFALLLGLHRRVHVMRDLQNAGEWSDQRWATFSRPLLRGQTIAILGYGAIGREVARVASTFGMRVLAYKRTPQQTVQTGFQLPHTGDPDGSIPEAYYGPNQLHEILVESDIVVDVLPATPETRSLLDADAFAAMQEEALFINIGRGSSVDEQALVDALRSGHLGGAGLDVFGKEPLPQDSPLWEVDTVIISPHVGGMFLGYDDVCVELFRQNLERYLAGRSLLNEIDRELGY